MCKRNILLRCKRNTQKANLMEDEELEEILGRLDIPIEAEESVEALTEYLATIFDQRTPAQIDAFPHIVERIWEGLDRTQDMAEQGIRRIQIEYPWGKELRYAIQGLPGLWGYQKMREILAAGE